MDKEQLRKDFKKQQELIKFLENKKKEIERLFKEREVIFNTLKEVKKKMDNHQDELIGFYGKIVDAVLFLLKLFIPLLVGTWSITRVSSSVNFILDLNVLKYFLIVIVIFLLILLYIFFQKIKKIIDEKLYSIGDDMNIVAKSLNINNKKSLEIFDEIEELKNK